MIIKNLIETDFVNYKKPSTFIIFPYCSFKCEKESGCQCCQNSALASQSNIDVSVERIVSTVINSGCADSVVMGGLEPFDSWKDVQELVSSLRDKTNVDIVIFTGYKEDEIPDKINWLKQYKNIIIKFGRFIPSQEKHYDSVLGVELASPNQYGKVIS